MSIVVARRLLMRPTTLAAFPAGDLRKIETAAARSSKHAGISRIRVHYDCLACHSVGMVLNQPAMSKAQWRVEVDKMRTAYKAPIDPKDVDTIVDYLAGIRGAN
jgi:hypothetical protein